jgi:NAD-dependent SIR2 family protein deacetylase
MDSIVNFGENLPDHELQKAFMHAKQADLCIVLGSSLRVTPAADIPEEVAKRGKLVICNLQQTPLDDCASLAIYAKCDDVMLGLANDITCCVCVCKK